MLISICSREKINHENQCQLFGQRSFHYLTHQEVSSSFTNLHGQKAVIKAVGATRNARTSILPAPAVWQCELKQQKYPSNLGK